MKRYCWPLGMVMIGLLAGCGRQQSGYAYNPQYDGLSGHTIAVVSTRILKDQQALYTEQNTPQANGASNGGAAIGGGQ